MKALVHNRYGSPQDVLRLEDIETPQVKDDEVLVRVGRNVARFQPGDEVFGSSFMRGFGGLAEWASVSDDLLGVETGQPLVRPGRRPCPWRA